MTLYTCTGLKQKRNASNLSLLFLASGDYAGDLDNQDKRNLRATIEDKLYCLYQDTQNTDFKKQTNVTPLKHVLGGHSSLKVSHQQHSLSSGYIQSYCFSIVRINHCIVMISHAVLYVITP